MAQQYIDVNNQTMLWKLIQRSPQFLNNTVNINREQWFGNIIKQFYEQITVPKFSIEELKTVNQKTIAYMLSDLKQMEQAQLAYRNGVGIRENTLPYDNKLSQPNLLNSTLSYDDISSPDKHRTPMLVPRIVPSSGVLAIVPRPETSSLSTANEQFNARQQEYTNMLKPPAQPIPNFSEKIDDDVITNMDELLAQQKKQREYDISQVILPAPQTVNPPPVIATPDSRVEKINIDSIYPAIQNLITQIESMKKDIQFLMADKISQEQKSETSQELDTNIGE
jgi:hypothetical protein